jgi:protoporphyrin/coproporphyrin ferrochelatase
MSRTAVVLCNLGGPDSLAAVEPFLRSLFSDPAVITLPQPLRWLVASLIARRRAPVARAIYAKLGGRSPLLAETEAQADALAAVLGPDHRVFVVMRHWRPRSDETAPAVAAWRPDRVVLLPLYPQFSTTTTASAVADWRRAARRVGLAAPTQVVGSFPEEPGFIASLAAAIGAALDAAPGAPPPRVLLSAHGLPKRIVARGDPYEREVEATAAALRRAVARDDVEMIVCYQSRVGPLEWLGPATDEEIRRAGAEGRDVIVVPIAFVSEHSETLVELDIDYRRVAAAAGVRRYIRVPTVGTAALFIAGLARLVRTAAA